MYENKYLQILQNCQDDKAQQESREESLRSQNQCWKFVFIGLKCMKESCLATSSLPGKYNFILGYVTVLLVMNKLLHSIFQCSFLFNI